VAKRVITRENLRNMHTSPNPETVKQVILSEKSMRKVREGAWAYSSPVSGTAEDSPALQALGRMVIENGSRPAPRDGDT
jgi:hypothetical protein